MKIQTLILALLVALSLACGGDDGGGKPAPEPGAKETGPIDARLSAESLTLLESEWYSVSPNRISSVTGRAVDENGRSLAGVTAQVLAPPPVPMAPAKLVRTVNADSTGLFTITDVPMNAWIRVAVEGDRSWIFKAPELQIQGDEPVQVRLLPGGEIRGLIRTLDGAPVAGVGVMVSNSTPRYAETTVTDESGQFHMKGAMAGPLTVWVMSETHTGVSASVEVVTGETVACEITVAKPEPVRLEIIDAVSRRPLAGVVGSTLFSRERNLTADDNGILIVEGVCFPRIWLRGRGYAALPVELPIDRSKSTTHTVTMVRGVTIRGRVVDVSGTPVANARVRVLTPANSPGLPTRGPLTAEDGSYEVSWVYGGEDPVPSAVFAEAPGYHLKKATLRPIQIGRDLDDATVVLARNQRVALRVVGTDGRPVASALVYMDGIEPIRAGAFEVFRTRSSGHTGPDGIVILSGVAPQRVAITVRAENRAPHSDRREVAAAPAPANPGETALLDLGDIRLAEGLVVAGRIRSTAGSISAKSVVHVSVGNIHEVVPILADGSFRCSGLPEGRLNLRINAPDHQVLLIDTDAGNENLDLVITAVGAIDIRIERPDDVHIRGRLELMPVGGRVMNRSPIVRPIEGKIDAYRFGRLVAGEYRLKLRSEDHFARTTFRLGHGESAKAVLILTLGTVVRGQLKLPDGSAAPGIGISLDSGEEWGSVSRVTDDEGKFEFRGVAPGSLTLRSHPMGYAPTAKAIEVVAGAAMDVDFALSAGGRIAITVRDASDRPVAGARVSVSRPDGSPARYWIKDGTRPRTGEDGTLTLIGLKPGKYQLSLFRDGSPQPWVMVSVEEGRTTEAKATLK